MLAVGAANFWINGRASIPRLRLRDAPMLAAALAFGAGILCARNFHSPAALLASTLALFTLTLIAMRWAQRLRVPCGLAFFIAIGCMCAQVQPPVSTAAGTLRFADGLSRNVRGHVVRVRELPPAELAEAPQEASAPWLAEPGAWEHVDGAPRLSLDLAIDAIEEVTPDTSTMVQADGGVRISIIGDAASFHCGQEIEVPLRLSVPDSLRNPGAFSLADWLAGQGINVTSTAKGASVTHLAASHRDPHCMLEAAQNWAAMRVLAYPQTRQNRMLPAMLRMNDDDVAMLSAMLFGERAALTHARKESFERTGSFHLFVVSGLHVTLLAGGLLFLMRRLRWRDEASIPAALAITTLYAAMTGLGAPVQRALMMTAAFLLARLFGRQSSALQALGVAAFLTLAIDPRALYEASFQMTTLVIFAVTGLARPLWARIGAERQRVLRSIEVIERDPSYPPRLAAFRVHIRMWHELASVWGPWPSRALLWAMRGFFAAGEAVFYGVVTECCMVLPMAVYFHRLTLWSVPLTILVMPVVGILLACAIVFFALLLIRPWLALPAAILAAIAMHAMRALFDFTSRLPGAGWRVPTPPAIALLCAGSLLLAACLLVREQRRAILAVGMAMIALAPLLALWPQRPLLVPAKLEVTAIDVGQGDSLFIASPDGHTMLVDAGGPIGGMTSASGWDVGEDAIAPFLWSRRVRRLDAVLLSHAHSDHMGGMAAIVRDFRPRVLWLSVDPADAPALHSLEALCAQLGVAVKHLHAGDAVQLGDASLRVLAPDPTYANDAEPVNNDSLVAELRWGQASVLLEGDAEAPSEAAMLAAGRIAPVTLLKVAHHGSRTSTTDELLAAAHPRMGVISVGRQNTFGHPRFEVLQRLEENHVQTFRTDRMGMVQFLLASDGTVQATPIGAGH